MNLYLVQHGEALSSEENPDRPLSEKGEMNVRRVGDFLYRSAGLVVPDVLHSGKLRAEQTAAMLARCLNGMYSESTDLSPNDDPDLWAARLEERAEDLMLVGHLPHLPRLAGLLLTGDTLATPVQFTNAGVLCLSRDDKATWRVNWAVTPELVSDQTWFLTPSGR